MKLKSKIKSKFTFIDLFAGIGGFRIALVDLGGECIFSSEIDKFAQKTYETNFGEAPAGDITKIDIKDIPNHDILTAGFPCQAFSIAGKRKGFEDARGTLFFDLAKIIKEKQPKAFILENVQGLLSHDKGKTFATILNILGDKENLDYQVFWKVLNTKDFGLPQNRKRVFIIGFKNQTSFEFPEGKELKIKLKNLLEPSPDGKYFLSRAAIECLLNHAKKQKEKGNGFKTSFVNKDVSFINTLTTRYYKDGSNCLIIENDGVRKLTPRECARLQGYPEGFIIPVSDTQSYKQFGNSVSIPVVRAVSQKVLESLKIG